MDKLPDIADQLEDVQDMVQQELNEIPTPPPPSLPPIMPHPAPIVVSAPPPPPVLDPIMYRLDSLEKMLQENLAQLRMEKRQEQEVADTGEALHIPMELVEPEPAPEPEQEKPKKRRPHL